MGTSGPPSGGVRPPLYGEPTFRPERSRSKLIAGAVVVAALAGLAFFLLGSAGSRLSGPIAKAATVSSRTAGYRMRMAIDLTSSALGTPVTATGRGVVDLRDQATSMSMVMNLGDDPQVIQQLGSSTMSIDTIAHGAVVYVKLPPVLTSALTTSGRPWMKIDLAKLSSLPGLSSLASNPTTGDPSHILQSLRSASDSVVNEGRQRVDGFKTTHYQAQLSLARLADGLPPAQRSAENQALSALHKALPAGQFPTDVWIDEHHLVRRVLMSLTLALPNGPSVQETVTIDIGHYGPQRLPAAPPADQVQDLSSLAGASG
ncbi:MAG TPA: hypothetical protein VHW04_06400 [Solirubrobacteraceae bacterium]|jgi:hypothetical protein|nr:hypothetical protein [Solirubrobacteraceae bacterium]